MTCDEAFDVWYAMQRHQLVNEELCRLIFRRGWEGAQMQPVRNPPFVGEWHAKAVALGYDGVADMLDSVERGEPPQHIAAVMARTAHQSDDNDVTGQRWADG